MTGQENGATQAPWLLLPGLVQSLVFKALGNLPSAGALRLRLAHRLQGTGQTTPGVLQQGFRTCQHTLKLYLARKIFKVLANALGFLSGICRGFQEGRDNPDPSPMNEPANSLPPPPQVTSPFREKEVSLPKKARRPCRMPIPN